MSLLFGGASTDRVDHGTGFSFGTGAWTALLWYYPTSDTGPQVLFWKTATEGGGAGRHAIERRFGDVDDFEVLVGRQSTDGICITTGVNRPLNAWKFVAVSAAAGDGGPRLFHGSLSASAVEASYASRSEGSGNFSAGAGLGLYFGNRSSFNEALVGRIAAVAVYPSRALSLGEIIEWQWNPRKTAGCELYTHYGFAGTGTQPDWSGTGNSGTVTGATVASHVPLGPVFDSGTWNTPLTTAAGNVAEPDAGTLVLTGLAPSILVDVVVRPDVDALVFEGLAPSVSVGLAVVPAAGNLVLAGLTPTVTTTDNRSVEPGTGALTLEGLAPTVVATDNHVVEPGVGALVLAGQQPAAVTGGNAIAQPEQAALVLDGLQPTITTTSNRTVEPGAGALVLGGLAPTISVTASIVVNPLTGALIFTGLTPTVVVSDNHVVEPGAGALVLEGLAPEIPVPSPVAEPGAGALALEGLAPTVVMTGANDVATDPKLIARRPNVHVDFGKRKKTPAPTPAPAQITNMPGHPPVPRPLAAGLLAALADSPLPPAAPTPAAPTPRATAVPAPTPAPTAAPTAAPVPRAAAAPLSPTPTKAVAAPAPVPVPAGIMPEQMAALLQRMDALSEGMSSRLVEVNKALQGDIERVTQLLEAERDARLAREKRERNEARAKQIAARLLGGE